MKPERIVYSAVAVPGEADSDGEILTAEEIRHAAHAYLKDYRIVDPEHVCALGACREVGNPVESYLTTDPMSVKSYDGTTLEFPSGTWIIGIDVFDDDTYSQIRKGEKRGVSLTAKSADGVTKSRVLIRDLGPDWVARTVSIVKNPAVPKARFFSKSVSDRMTENQEEEVITRGFDRFIDAIKSLGKQEETEEAEADESIKSEENQEEEVTITYVTHEELEATKSEILEAIKAIAPPEQEEAEDDGEEEEEEEAEEEEETVEEPKATKSKAIPDHLQTDKVEAVKNLYEDDGRDMYGRVIRK